jgi:hypothetical protein
MRSLLPSKMGRFTIRGMQNLLRRLCDPSNNLSRKGRRKIVKKINLAVVLFMALAMVSGCYYYAPAPYVVTSQPHSNYDQIWDSAMRAAQDIGISITSSNKNTGTAVGQRDDVSVTIQVTRRSDGTTRVGLSATGSQSATSAINDDFNRAYNHYMGR